MASSILQVPGKVNASHALVVTGDTGTSTGSTPAPIAGLPGKVDSSNRLVIKFE